MMTTKITPLELTGPSHTEDLEGKCMVLWVQNGGKTEEWNGDRCDCELIQGNYNCKLNPF
jgi:hypothetical protein